MSGSPEFHRYKKQHPELGTDPIPVYPYASADFFAQEKTKVFRRSWLNVGRVAQIASKGDFFVKDVAVCDTQALITHGQDGKIRAFHNVCRHRGTTLVWEESGCKNVFVCKFHGWSYDTTGCLRNITDEENFNKLDKNKLGLVEIACDVWAGFIFICLEPEESLQEYLGAFGERLSAYPFDKLSHRGSYTMDERVNWKVLLDAQQEGYHVPHLHKQSFSSTFFKQGAPAFRTKSFKTYGNHRVLSVGSLDGVEPTPTAAEVGKFGVNAMDGSYRGRFGEADVIDGVLDFCVIFPNFVLGLMNGSYFTYNIWPIAEDRTVWDVDLCYPEPEKPSEIFCNEYAKCAFRDALLEDGSTHERVQIGLMSGAIDTINFQDEEIAARHGVEVVLDMVGT